MDFEQRVGGQGRSGRKTAQTLGCPSAELRSEMLEFVLQLTA